MKVFKNVTNLIGNTPIVELNNIKKELNLNFNLYAKLEYLNPAGSIKDRIALNMIDDLEEKNLICKGATIIEPTSGNTGIGLACVCASKGYKLILVMPENMSKERQSIVKFYGAEIVLTSKDLGMKGCLDKAKQLNESIENSVILGQFDNNANPLMHYKTTAKEIYEDLGDNLDVLIAGVGTGGTISGIGQYLKEKNNLVEIIAVEPEDSPLISKGYASTHNLQGIGANFIPKTLNLKVIDKILTAKEKESFQFARLLAKKEGIAVGISSGAVLSVAISLNKDKKYVGKNILIICPDSADRYYSTKLFDI